MTLLNAGRSGFTGAMSISLGVLDTCPAVASNARGQGLLAGSAGPHNLDRSFNGVIRAAALTREAKPGATTDIAQTAPYVDELVDAVDEQGQAIVAWFEEGAGERMRVRAAIRKPDGTWGPAFEVVQPIAAGLTAYSLTVTPDQTGGFFVGWVETRNANARSNVRLALVPGGAATSVVTIGRGHVGSVEATSTPDGRVLIVHDANGKLHLLERAPGASEFARPQILTENGRYLYAPELALRADGAMVLASWFSDPRGRRDLGLAAWMRPANGDFGPAQIIMGARRVRLEGGYFDSRQNEDHPTPPDDPTNGALQVGLAPDGRALLTFGWGRRTDGDSPEVVAAVSGSLVTGFSKPERLGSPCRSVDGATPVLTGNVLAMVWTDNLSQAAAQLERPIGHGLLHLAVPGLASPAAAPAPHARLRVPYQALRYADPLKARASCDRACELRAFVVGRNGREIAVGSTSLPRRGSTAMRIGTLGSQYQIGSGRSGPVKVSLHACSPGSSKLAATSTIARVDLVPPKPLPRLSDIKAHREGRTIVITWTLSEPDRDDTVSPDLHGRGVPNSFSTSTSYSADGRHVTMRVSIKHPERVRLVTLMQTGSEPPYKMRAYPPVRVK
jgi:hypothetical protein